MESCGLIVCSKCGFVVSPVYVSSRKVVEDYRKGRRNFRENSNGSGVEKVLEALASELGVPSSVVLEFYNRLKRRVGKGEAAAIALFVAAKRNGGYVSLGKACRLLSLYGVPARRERALKALLALSSQLRPTLEEALRTYAEKLSLPTNVLERAAEILKLARPYTGGRDPFLVALAAIHIASGSFTIYELAKATKRSPGRLYANVTYLRKIFAQYRTMQSP